MDYITQTIDSDILTGILDIPVSLRHIKVEIIIKPAEFEDIQHNKDDSAFGIFHKYADPSKIDGEKGAWERAVAENYANR
jgi:hypothetical protein